MNNTDKWLFYGCDTFGPKPIWSPDIWSPTFVPQLIGPSGQTVPNQFSPHGQMVPKNVSQLLFVRFFENAESAVGMKLHVLVIVGTLFRIKIPFFVLLQVWLDSFGYHNLLIIPLQLLSPCLFTYLLQYITYHCIYIPFLVRAIFALPLLTVSCLFVRLNYCIKKCLIVRYFNNYYNYVI